MVLGTDSGVRDGAISPNEAACAYWLVLDHDWPLTLTVSQGLVDLLSILAISAGVVFMCASIPSCYGMLLPWSRCGMPPQSYHGVKPPYSQHIDSGWCDAAPML